MCGIFGVVVCKGQSPAFSRERLAACAGLLAHRGGDGHGFIAEHNYYLAHHRLSIVNAAGDQPRVGNKGGILCYNGEVYNAPELGGDVSDTALVQQLLETNISDVSNGENRGLHLSSLRGMFALGYLDPQGTRLLLSRDPLGIKPLYYARAIVNGVRHIMFASEPIALASLLDDASLGLSLTPDWTTVGSYLTTIRTTLGERTLFEQIRCVQAGETLTFDLLREDQPVSRNYIKYNNNSRAHAEPPRQAAVEDIEYAVRDSVRSHLVGDAPICTMLSGGLDSTIITSIVSKERGGLNTYSIAATGENGGDAQHAVLAAKYLGTSHTHITLCGEEWVGGVRERIERSGLPLSTPNEVAIASLARKIRADGFKVVLSGEGADEIFAGYSTALDAAQNYITNNRGASHYDHARYAIANAAWVPLEHKHLVMNDAGDDQELTEYYSRIYCEEHNNCSHSRSGCNPALTAHLGLMRRINLEGLLLRLDACTMASAVEGRTPFADVRVASLAASIDIQHHYTPQSNNQIIQTDSQRTKKLLRQAFKDQIPREVLHRSKASFPLPFTSWLASMTAILRESNYAGEVFTPQSIAAVVAQPTTTWALCWPMVNIALWLERWWGDTKPAYSNAITASSNNPSIILTN